MQMVYDILGSMIIGGMILVMVLGFNTNLIEGSGLQVFKTTVQGNMTTVTNILEYDFRKMGFLVPSVQDTAITYADSTKIVFKGDIDNNGSIDRVTYYFDPTKPAGTTNPRAGVLFRTINNGPRQSINVGITRFRLQYNDTSGIALAGNVVSGTNAIRSVRVLISMESREPYDALYAGVCWDRTIKPKNLR